MSLVFASQVVLSKSLSILAFALNLVAGLFVIVLVHLEHFKSVRPSFLIALYLSMTILLDAAHTRTAWLISSDIAIAASLTASVATKLLLLALESFEKQKWLLHSNQKISSEVTSGPLNRGLFVWLLGLLKAGYFGLLSPNDLPSIHEKLVAERLAERFGHAWESCKFPVSTLIQSKLTI